MEDAPAVSRDTLNDKILQSLRTLGVEEEEHVRATGERRTAAVGAVDADLSATASKHAAIDARGVELRRRVDALAALERGPQSAVPSHARRSIGGKPPLALGAALLAGWLLGSWVSKVVVAATEPARAAALEAELRRLAAQLAALEAEIAEVRRRREHEENLAMYHILNPWLSLGDASDGGSSTSWPDSMEGG